MAHSFGAAVDAYEAGRPEYPASVPRWLLEPVAGDAVHVADIGAGTGKLTRGLLAAGADVVAVEPDAGMLAELRLRTPGLDARQGTAQALPLADASFDAVTYGQVWHWLDAGVAAAEAARVLRPGGVIGLAWNVRDERVGWVAEMTRIMHGSAGEAIVAGGGPRLPEPFGVRESAQWEWACPMTRAMLEAMVRSRSYVITAEPAERARIERDVAAVFDGIGAVGDAVVPLPYVTHAYRAVRS